MLSVVEYKESGAGGNRTLVQTGKQYAFYMLILAFIFVRRQDPDHQPEPYSLKLHPRIGTCEDYSRFSYTALPDASEQELLSDVSSPQPVRRLSQ